MLLASASIRFYECIEIFLSIIIDELGSRIDACAGEDEHPPPSYDSLAIGSARMIDITGGIRSDVPVDRLPRTDLEKILAALSFRIPPHQHIPGIFDDADPLGDILPCKEPLSRQCAAHRKCIPARGIFGNTGCTFRCFHIFHLVRGARKCGDAWPSLPARS